ncbi:hypothetical protein [Neorhizobium galegae]|uniref:hypothetical protein n=1 Tax=Neorhizobium galegae TaxID=399 RepID=UPI000620FC84|nr:hypothetical protein [Neorhizobium galegae]KAB1126306.1 hypothetical protein F4V90_04105 [Neorhizobium galegae]MCQ1805278.1 hypothetical protein [Neorhizobium galegae]CDZ56039.1 Hypothetical protein NGAL_HAMBI2566_05890 [Neorhizobium galegae bv. orientalis]
MSKHAADIIQLGEFLTALGASALSLQTQTRELVGSIGELVEQVHTAQRRLKMLEHSAGILANTHIPGLADDEQIVKHPLQ